MSVYNKENGKLRKMVEQLYMQKDNQPSQDDLVNIIVEFGAIGPDESYSGALAHAKKGAAGLTPQKVEFIPGNRIPEFYYELENILDGQGSLKFTPAPDEIDSKQFYQDVSVLGPKGEKVIVERENLYAYKAEVLVPSSLWVRVDLAIRSLLTPIHKDYHIFEVTRRYEKSR